MFVFLHMRGSIIGVSSSSLPFTVSEVKTFCVSLGAQKTHPRRNLDPKSSERYLVAVFARLDDLNQPDVKP